MLYHLAPIVTLDNAFEKAQERKHLLSTLISCSNVLSLKKKNVSILHQCNKNAFDFFLIKITGCIDAGSFSAQSRNLDLNKNLPVWLYAKKKRTNFELHPKFLANVTLSAHTIKSPTPFFLMAQSFAVYTFYK